MHTAMVQQKRKGVAASPSLHTPLRVLGPPRQPLAEQRAWLHSLKGLSLPFTLATSGFALLPPCMHPIQACTHAQRALGTGTAGAAHRGRAGLGASGSKTPPHKPCGKWSKTQPLLAPWSMALGCLCWSSKQLTAWAVFGVQDVTPALGHLLALTDTRPCAPLGSSAKDGRARLSLLLRANYPPISLGKDSVDVCKISIH